MYRIYLLMGLLIMVGCSSDRTAEREIRDRLAFQEECWNSGDLECFMIGYWESDSLMFIGKERVIYGYQNTLQRYYNTYPNRSTMGKLNFEIKHTKMISEDVYFVVGSYYLTREEEIGDLQGHFTLLWRKIDSEWFIVADHSS